MIFEYLSEVLINKHSGMKYFLKDYFFHLPSLIWILKKYSHNWIKSMGPTFLHFTINFVFTGKTTQPAWLIVSSTQLNN